MILKPNSLGSTVSFDPGNSQRMKQLFLWNLNIACTAKALLHCPLEPDQEKLFELQNDRKWADGRDLLRDPSLYGMFWHNCAKLSISWCKPTRVNVFFLLHVKHSFNINFKNNKTKYGCKGRYMEIFIVLCETAINLCLFQFRRKQREMGCRLPRFEKFKLAMSEYC